MRVDYKVLGSSPKEMSITSGSTVGDLKEKLGLTKHTAAVNGQSANDAYELSDGDYVTFSESVKGGI